MSPPQLAVIDPGMRPISTARCPEIDTAYSSRRHRIADSASKCVHTASPQPHRGRAQQNTADVIVVLGGFPRESAKDHIERCGRAYLRLRIGGRGVPGADQADAAPQQAGPPAAPQPGQPAPPLADAEIQRRCGFVELFSPWLLSSVAHIRYERKNERQARNVIELARRFDGQVRMGAAPLTLWMSMLKSKAERDRNRRLIRVAEETQRHLEARHVGEASPSSWPAGASP